MSFKREEEQNREEGEIGSKSGEEGEIGSESREKADLLPCFSPLFQSVVQTWSESIRS